MGHWAWDSSACVLCTPLFVFSHLQHSVHTHTHTRTRLLILRWRNRIHMSHTVKPRNPKLEGSLENNGNNYKTHQETATLTKLFHNHITTATQPSTHSLSPRGLPSIFSERLSFDSTSPGILRGWLQQVLVQTFGNVIFATARCCKRSLPSELNRNTLNARWSRPFLIFTLLWPNPRQMNERNSSMLK